LSAKTVYHTKWKKARKFCDFLAFYSYATWLTWQDSWWGRKYPYPYRSGFGRWQSPNTLCRFQQWIGTWYIPHHHYRCACRCTYKSQRGRFFRKRAFWSCSSRLWPVP